VRSSATLELTVKRADDQSYEVTIPDSPSTQAAAFGTVATSTMVGGWLAEQLADGTAVVVVGPLTGMWAGTRLWNRWVRDAESAQREGGQRMGNTPPANSGRSGSAS
jgi:hypothetical protein